MTTDSATAGIRLVLVSLADGETDGVPVGWYLASYDPEANDGNGTAMWTPDGTQALRFPSEAEAMAYYRAVPRNRPLRPDGKPNRPLTVFSVMIG